MALGDHPNVFRFEGRLWVSERPREEALAAFVAQRAWDSAQLKRQRWWPAIIIGAVIGVAVALGAGIALHIDITLDLVTLPVGFGAGAVLGALVNRRLLGPELPPTVRPELPHLVRIPARVARAAPEDASARDLIAWSNQGFVK